MKEVSVFIASSVREFERERLEISPYLEMLNGVYKRLDVQVKWNRPEIEFGELTMGGSQTTLDGYVKECDLFALIVGERVGKYTEHEFEIALERFRRTEGKAPIILPCFLQGGLSPESAAFLNRIRTLDIGAQYIDPYDNFDAVLTRLQMVLTNYVVSVMDMGDEEADLNRARERMIDKIRALRDEAKRLEAAPPSLENVAELTTTYAQIARLVREYKVAPEALLDYIQFLWKQYQYDMGIELGHWLEGYYTMENPGDDAWSVLKDTLGQCYEYNHQYANAERYYREALEIARRLAEKNPVYETTAATVSMHLGSLLQKTKRTEEAEPYYREALEICRRLAEIYPNTRNIVVACIHLANLLRDTNRFKEAEGYYREALKICQRLSQINPYAVAPDMAHIYNNLAILLQNANLVKEAEGYYRKALEIRRGLAQANPGDLDSLAETCGNLATLLDDTNRREEAEGYYREALEIYKKLAQTHPAAFEPYVAQIYSNLMIILEGTDRKACK